MTSEERKFAIMAALLDPAAYRYVTAGFDMTVPIGKPWYVVNAWEIKSTNGRWFHRKLGIDDAILLPPETRVKSVNQSSFLYYAEPDSVITSDCRYYDDPKGLYYERLERLESLPLYEITGTRPAGTSKTAPVTGVAFPNDFDKGLISHISVMDLCWIILAGGTYQNSNVMRASNCLDEINDVHLVRFTAKVLQPFINGMYPGNNGNQWNGIWCGHGVEGDDFSKPQTRDGTGTLHYYKLPANW